MIRLVIAEKPKVGRAIAAAILPSTGRQDGSGFIRQGDTIVTWCFGHLLEPAPPGSYSPALEKWTLDSLPFSVKEGEWKLVPRKDANDQLRLIQQLLHSATEVVNAGYPDREGQLLVDEVLHHFGWEGRTHRLILKDLNLAPIRKAWQDMQDNAAYRNLYHAGLCRQRADWLVGMNLTRAASLRIGLTASIGRVQTPTLGLVVARDLAIEQHRQRTFYVLEATTSTRMSSFVATHGKEDAERIFDKAQAQGLAERLAGQIVDVSVTASVKRENPPLPFILSSFQEAAEKAHGWGAKDALDILQALYESGYVSYPRTDCPYLPEEHIAGALAIADGCIARLGNGEYAALRDAMKPSPDVYNDKKVAEHYGIVPTSTTFPTNPPDTPPSNWKKLEAGWMLVADRFLKTLLPPAIYDVTEAAFVFEQRTFRAKGEALRAGPSWRQLEPRETTPLHLDIPPGSSGKARVGKVDIHTGKTTPPKPYTEATLIADMRAAAKFATDPKIKAMLKETAGIGTSATQASIIETLKQRGYIALEGRGKRKALRSTPFGRYVIEHLPKPLTDVAITAVWEQHLAAIEHGETDPADFLGRIERFVAKQVGAIKDYTFPVPPKPEAPARRAASKGGAGESASPARSRKPRGRASAA